MEKIQESKTFASRRNTSLRTFSPSNKFHRCWRGLTCPPRTDAKVNKKTDPGPGHDFAARGSLFELP